MLRPLVILCLGVALSSCFLRNYPVTPHVVEGSTFMMLVETGDGYSEGTAWAVAPHFLITAGHMCEDRSATSIMQSPSTGRKFYARSVTWEKSEDDGRVDLCLLVTDVTLEPLIISDVMPYVGEAVHYVGFPLGVERFSDGTFLGDLDSDDHWDDAVASTPCDHGASGSPVFTSRGVWGVLVRVRTDGPDGAYGTLHDGTDGCAMIPLDHLRAFLNDTHVPYLSRMYN